MYRHLTAGKQVARTDEQNDWNDSNDWNEGNEREGGGLTLQRKDFREQELELRSRQALVQRVRREIAAGTYDTPEKWEITLDRLAEHLLSA